MKKNKQEPRILAEKFRRKFLDLPLWLRMLAVSTGVLLLAAAVFFLTGSYLYSPQKTARDYYEAQLAGDWNTMYDCCRFPEGRFLSRKNFVNAMSYGKDSKEEAPRIKNYRIRKTGTDGKHGIYQMTCTLEGISESQKETVKIARGEKILGPFYEWYIVPEELYVKNVEFVVPADAQLYLDGTKITGDYLREGKAAENESAESDSQDVDRQEDGKTDKSVQNMEEAVYEIPYVFLGYHTIQIQEKGKDEYREIVPVKSSERIEILPELKLNDANGKKIADKAESLVQEFCEAGMKKHSYSQVSDYFLDDVSVQKKAEKAFDSFRKRAADEKSTGIVKLALTGIETTVSSADGKMEAQVNVSYTAEKVEKKLFFFYHTVTESGTRSLKLQLKNSQGDWKVADWE